MIWSDHIDSGWNEAIDLKVGHIDPGHVADGWFRIARPAKWPQD